MILACPLCKTQYLLPAQAFAQGARVVRCAKCANSWRAEPPGDVDVVALQTQQMPPYPAASQPDTPAVGGAGSALPDLEQSPLLPVSYDGPTPDWAKRYVRYLAAAIIMFLFVWALLDKQDIVGRWPYAEKIYQKLGIHIYHTGEGLNIEDVRSELQYDGGIVLLVVQGRIDNETDKVLTIPPIRATAVGAGGGVIETWQVELPTSKLQPAELVPFRSTITAPKETVVSVKLDFIEPKHEQ